MGGDEHAGVVKGHGALGHYLAAAFIEVLPHLVHAGVLQHGGERCCSARLYLSASLVAMQGNATRAKANTSGGGNGKDLARHLPVFPFPGLKELAFLRAEAFPPIVTCSDTLV
jgi:hypothetical protein